METICNAVRYLNSAESTRRFQSFFGVECLPVNLREQSQRLPTDADVLLSKSSGPHNSELTPSSSYHLTKRWAYYLFKFGSFLGQEEFYISFFPFWFWNFDGATGRKMIIAWTLTMYIGQFIKEQLRWARPSSPPVVYLEKLFLSEYGMPSTHAIVAACVPFSIVYFERELCQLSSINSFLVVFLFIILVCSSRLYVGVHTCIEVLTGLFISLIVMSAYIPVADRLDRWLMSSLLGPAAVIWLCIGASLIYPSDGGRWSNPWADTVSILSVGAGVIGGHWLGFRSGIWSWEQTCLLNMPDLTELLQYVLRTILGLCIVLLTRQVVKPACYTCAAMLNRVSVDKLKEKRWVCVELPAKFLTYFAVAFNVCFTVPTVLLWLGLKRNS